MKKRRFPLARLLASSNARHRQKAEQYLRDCGTDAVNVLVREFERLQSKKAFFSPSLFGLNCPTAFLFMFVVTSLSHKFSWARLLVTLLFQSFIWGIYYLCAAIHNRPLQAQRRRVVVELTRRNHVPAILWLLELWEPNESGEDARAVETELARVLPVHANASGFVFDAPQQKIPRHGLRSLYHRNRCGLWTPRYALTNAEADILITMIQVLSRSSAEEDRAVVAGVAQSETRTDNQAFVRDAARACLPLPSTPRCPISSVAPTGLFPVTPFAPTKQTVATCPRVGNK